MNREIKFRAWDNKNKKWLCGYEYPNLGGFSLLGETVLLGGWSGVLDRFLMGGDGYKPDDLIVMQYTGFHDKNGKEIYEGDILGNDEGAERTKVEWNEQSGEWTLNGLENLAKWVSLLKIIGNIYENPELTK